VSDVDTDAALTCSAKGCSQPATMSLLWNNPKIHLPDRRKTWLACDQHARSLSEFLAARGFLRDSEPVARD
jgi:YD repeat-containing protein